jgi:hypothetical protein
LVARSQRKRLEDRCVAFVDILGFSDIVRRMSDEKHLFTTVRDMLGIVEKQCQSFQHYRKQIREKNSQSPLLRLASPQTDLQMTGFSDSYIISEVMPAWHILATVHALGSRFLAEGILTRGGIVCGQTYHHRRVVFGPGVNRAYEFESHVASYPRILIDDSVRQEVWGYHKGIWNEQLLKRDSDGCWYVNLLVPSQSYWAPLSHLPASRNVRTHIKSVRAPLAQAWARAKGNPSYMSKVGWMIHKFNKVARLEKVEQINRD